MAGITADVASINSDVSDRINQVDEIAADAISDVTSFLDELKESMQFDVPFLEWNPYFIDLPRLAITAQEPTRPDLDAEINRALTGLRSPAEPSLVSVGDLGPLAIGEFANKMPELDLPTIPEPTFPSAPADVDIAEVALPERPAITLPTPPTIEQFDIPAPPADTIPAFTGTIPNNNLVPPVNSFQFTETEYISTLLDAIKAKDLNTVQNGGVGLGAEIEVAMIERMKERDEKLIRDAIDELTAEYSEKAFELPTGVLVAATRKLISDYADKKQDQSREITIEQAKLALENFRIAISNGVQVEQILIAHHDAVAERALNAAKATVDAAVAIFNAEVADYNSKLEAVRVAAMVYDTEVRASMQRIEYYKAQIESLKVKSEIQMQYVELYKAELSGLEALLGMYKTDMEAANLALGSQKLKIDIFAKKIDAFSAQINAEAAKYQAYLAKNNGELAKATAFEAAAKGYLAYVEGKKVVGDIQIATADAKVKSNDQKIRKYEADIALWRAAYANAMERVRSAAQLFEADAGIYKANIGMAEAEGRLHVEQEQIISQNINAQAQLALKALETNLAAFIQVVGLKKEAAYGGAQVSATKLSALMNSFTTVVQLAASGVTNKNET